MVFDEVELKARVGRIFGGGKAPRDFLQRRPGLERDLLVALHVADLLVIIEADQIIGVGRVLVAGMDFEKTARGLDRFVVIA